jgi:hypothetical protein
MGGGEGLWEFGGKKKASGQGSIWSWNGWPLQPGTPAATEETYANGSTVTAWQKSLVVQVIT